MIETFQAGPGNPLIFDEKPLAKLDQNAQDVLKALADASEDYRVSLLHRACWANSWCR
jgi:hypothetical protein